MTQVLRPQKQLISNFVKINKNTKNKIILFPLQDSPASVIPSPALSRKSSGASFATPPTSRKSSEIRESAHAQEIRESAARPSSIEESCNRISGVNDSLSTLAQSYFTQPQRPASRKPSLKEETNTVRDEDQKASLVASFFGPGGAKPAQRSSGVPR